VRFACRLQPDYPFTVHLYTFDDAKVQEFIAPTPTDGLIAVGQAIELLPVAFASFAVFTTDKLRVQFANTHSASDIWM
jgi:hypothetical protein